MKAKLQGVLRVAALFSLCLWLLVQLACGSGHLTLEGPYASIVFENGTSTTSMRRSGDALEVNGPLFLEAHNSTATSLSTNGSLESVGVISRAGSVLSVTGDLYVEGNLMVNTNHNGLVALTQEINNQYAEIGYVMSGARCATAQPTWIVPNSLEHVPVTGQVTTIDLALLDGSNIDYRGGVCDNDGYCYIAPHSNYFATRIDTRVDIRHPAAIKTIDLNLVNGALRYFTEGFVDPDSSGLFFGPGLSPVFIRIDRHIFEQGSVTHFDATPTAGYLKGFHGGTCLNGKAYYAPWTNGSSVDHVVRITADIFQLTELEYFHLKPVDSSLSGFRGATHDGTYVYYAPGAGGTKLVRIDSNDFSATGVQIVDTTSVSPFSGGYFGTLIFGDHVYLLPGEHGYITRVSTASFNTGSVQFIDMATIGPNMTHFSDGFVSNRGVLYLSPHKSFNYHDTLARLDLTGPFSTDAVEVIAMTEVGAGGFFFGAGYSSMTNVGVIIGVFNGLVSAFQAL